MNALTDGYGGTDEQHDVGGPERAARGGDIAVLAARWSWSAPSCVDLGKLATLAGALEGVEAEHLRPLEPAVKAINQQFDIIVGGVSTDRREGEDRRRKEALMTLVWIGDAILVLVVIPIVVYLLRGVLTASSRSCRACGESRPPPRAGPPTSTRCRCCSRPRSGSSRRSATVADYGGSLNTILDDDAGGGEMAAQD